MFLYGLILLAIAIGFIHILYLALRGYFNTGIRETIEKMTPKQRWGEVKAFTIILAVIILSFIGSIACFKNVDMGSSSSGSEWNNLSDEEKEWYIRNYGDGKMDDINDAIKDYRGY